MQRLQASEDEDEEMAVKEEDDYLDGDEHAEARYLQVSPQGQGAMLPAVAMAPPATVSGGGGRRSRAREEKERTKLRERQRRAITARILAGLRRHSNYNLRVRADINEVIAALAREAGWVVLPDGTTFPSSSCATQPQVRKWNHLISQVGSAQLSPAQLSSARSRVLGRSDRVSGIYDVINRWAGTGIGQVLK